MAKIFLVKNKWRDSDKTGLWRLCCRVKSWKPGDKSATTPSSPLETQSTPILGPGTSTLSRSSKTVSWRRTQLKSAETIQTQISRVTKIVTTKCQKGTLRTKPLELSPYGSQTTWRVFPQMSDLTQVFFHPKAWQCIVPKVQTFYKINKCHVFPIVLSLQTRWSNSKGSQEVCSWAQQFFAPFLAPPLTQVGIQQTICMIVNTFN